MWNKLFKFERGESVILNIVSFLNDTKISINYKKISRSKKLVGDSFQLLCRATPKLRKLLSIAKCSGYLQSKRGNQTSSESH